MYGDLKIRYSHFFIRSVIVVLVIVALLSCREKHLNNASVSRPGSDEMADINKYLVQKDRERIRNYIERKNLKMFESQSGLWYQIVKEGEGKTFSENDKVVFDYECSLLDGTKCYSSKNLGPKEIVLGKSNTEPGLTEGLRLLKPGAEAIFIMPPFLAYGFVGDRKMIPSRAIIVYNVNILQTK